MGKRYCVRDVFELPAENHGHPGGISKVVMGPGAASSERIDALDTERLIVHTNEYVVDGILDVPIHARRRRPEDHPGPIHPS